jgi:hypothetical protein
VRPSVGIALELVGLAFALYVAYVLSGWYPFSVAILLLVQVLTTFLIHCPAHYIVGRALGIRFRRISLGRSTADRVLPESLKRIGSLIMVLTLSVDPESRKRSRPSHLRAMFLAGVTGSVVGAVTFAYAVSLTGNLLAGLVTWAFAIAYLASDVLFSPEAGDMMRARAAMRPVVSV